MVVLLLTGAIDISTFDVPSTSLTNIQLRLSQYLSSISYAIDHYSKITHIVFCENTGFHYDYSGLKKRARLQGKQLEILSFKGDYSSIKLKGKGYGEGEIISYALKNSEIVRSCSVFYKLTGRVIIRNMDRVITKTSFENAFDYHQGKIYNREKDHIETIFFKANKDFYLKYLNDSYLEVDEGRFIYLEHLFYWRLKKLKLNSFPIYPRISGQSGTTGKLYDKGVWERNLERVYYFNGIHKIDKNIIEKTLAALFIFALTVWRKLK